MEVTFDKWTRGNMTVTSLDGATPLYNITCHPWTHKLDFHAAESGAEVAQSDFHCYKSSFEVTWTGQVSINIHSDKYWRIQRSYDSPAFQQKITWKSQSELARINYVCLDERALPVARFVSSNKWKKAGVLEIDPSYTLTEAQRNEIVVIGVSLVWQVLQNMTAASTASSGAAASSAAAAAASA